MLKIVADALIELTDGDDFASYAGAVASGLKKFHDALQEKGFSPDQATTIVAGQGISFIFGSDS